MDKPFDLMAIIEQWQVDYCKEAKSKRYNADYYQVPFDQRKELLTILVCQIKALGKPKEFFSNTRRDEIVNEMIPRGRHVEKAIIDGARGATRKALNWVILRVYAEDAQEIKIEKPKEIVKENIFAPRSEETVEPKVVKRKHDPSLYANEPAPSRELDPEMVELLGLKDRK